MARISQIIGHSPLRQMFARANRTTLLSPQQIAPQQTPKRTPVPTPTPLPPARTPAAPQQGIGGTLTAMSRVLGNISAGLGAATPQQRTQIADVLGEARGALGRVSATIPAPPTAPATQPTPEPILQLGYGDRMRALLGKYEGLLTAQPPTPTGMTAEERQLFTQERENLRARYDTALTDLRRRQEEDRQRLIGRYAAMGFTEPGVIAGPIAGEPGIVTRGILRKREGQERELGALEQARAGDVLAIAQAEQEAGRRAREEERTIFERRQEAARRNLENLLQLAQPERFTAGGRVFERDLMTGDVRDITPPEALQRQVEVERGGRRLQITLDAEGREIGSVDLGPVPVRVERTPEPPALVQEWAMAGGQAGTGMSLGEWLRLMRGRAGDTSPGGGDTPPMGREKIF